MSNVFPYSGAVVICPQRLERECTEEHNYGALFFRRWLAKEGSSLDVRLNSKMKLFCVENEQCHRSKTFSGIEMTSRGRLPAFSAAELLWSTSQNVT